VYRLVIPSIGVNAKINSETVNGLILFIIILRVLNLGKMENVVY
jgi:hypothetical protein